MANKNLFQSFAQWLRPASVPGVPNPTEVDLATLAPTDTVNAEESPAFSLVPKRRNRERLRGFSEV
jgi:hypothetical protein